MPTDLRAAATAARREAAGLGPPPDDTPTYTPADLPDVEYTDPITDPDVVPVHVAWTRVMRDVRGIGKGSRLEMPGLKPFNYRGVDEVFNAAGPALRRHGVTILPVRVDAVYRDTRTSKGNAMRECTCTVDYLIVGPDGGTLPTGQSRGEAVDTMDKGTTKAMSVAYRNFLLQALCVPTNLPDPEASGVERGEHTRTAASYRDEALDTGTSLARLRQMRGELKDARRLGELVTNEVGEPEPIAALIDRVGSERKAAAEPAGDAEWPPATQPGGQQP
jgi:hypothetical protein